MVSYHEVSLDGDIVLNLYYYLPKHEELPSGIPEELSNDGFPSPELISETVRIRVSSTYLNCYPTFEKLVNDETSPFRRLSGPSKTGPANTIEISLNDDDPTAMLLLMKIIHGNLNSTPNVKVNTLWELAILIGKYRIQSHHVKVCYSEWRRGGLIRTSQNTTSALLFLCLSWMFQDEHMFYDQSKYLILESRNRLSTDLPIPGNILGQYLPVFSLLDPSSNIYLSQTATQSVPLLKDIIDGIDRQRKNLLKALFDEVEKFPSRYYKESLCDSECGTHVQLLLSRFLESASLKPFPEPPYNGVSINDTIQRISHLPLRSTHLRPPGVLCSLREGCQPGYDCYPDTAFTEMLEAITAKSKGLWPEEVTNRREG